MTDLEIARKAAASMRRIIGLAEEKLGIPEKHLEPFGHYKAKLCLKYIESLEEREDGKLILVTSTNPTPAGEGKTTTTIGLGDALNRIGNKSIKIAVSPIVNGT